MPKAIRWMLWIIAALVLIYVAVSVVHGQTHDLGLALAVGALLAIVELETHLRYVVRRQNSKFGPKHS